MRSYLFFGPPGSGKGTQRGLFEASLDKRGEPWLSIDTGALLRAFARDTDSQVAKRLADVMGSGGLVPSAFPIAMWVRTLSETEASYDHLIIDGAGRKPVEARVLVDLLFFMRNMTVHTFLLNIPDDEVTRRLVKRGREDDREDVIHERLERYRDGEEGTSASIAFLRHNDQVRFHDVDGIGTTDEVHRRIMDCVAV